MNDKLKNSIVYVSIINNKSEPILMKNYNHSKQEELNFQMNIFATLDMIDNQITKKILVTENKSQISSFLGCLNSVYLAEDEFDIYGFYTVGQLKILVILRQKSNMANYDERHIKNLMNEIYQFYRQDILNPFNQNIDDHQLSKKFHSKLDETVNKYQEILKKGI
ncbi:hypothetical protein ABPG74_017648 [Tetrahymena malaccensis]